MEEPEEGLVRSISRRDFATGMSSLLPAYAVLHWIFAGDLLADRHRAGAHRWLLRLNRSSDALLGGRLTPLEWQAEVERLFGGLRLPELVELVDLDRLSREIEKPPDRAAAHAVMLPDVEGLPSPTAFATKVFALRKGVAIVPHGHRNMVSMHLVLGGELRLRHFDRLHDEPDHLIIQPTIDRVAKPGDLSSISSQKDNVHWFQALSEGAFTLDIIVDNLDPTLGFRYEMDFIDPVGGKAMDGGRIRARRISFEQALRLYGP